MSDPRDVLAAKFSASSRYANFGNVLEKIHISGFRIHKDTVLEIKSPITAICGLNGTGKSTVLQVAAAAYKNAVTPQYFFKNFFIVGKLDPTPYTASANVVYSYAEPDGKPGKATIARNVGARRKGWTGYKRRRTRGAFYGGVGMFIPKVEKRDFLVYGAANLVIDTSEVVPAAVKDWVSQILGRAYAQMHAVNAHMGAKSGRILRLHRNSVEYSEAHMGFGEGRVSYLVETLETIPEKSLILMEEPETSLHPSAQHQMGQYFMDVCIRRGHQIILTTHSEYLLRALPSDSRVFFHLDSAGVLAQLWGLTAAQAASLMTEGRDKALTVLVEDACAKSLLTEIIRRSDTSFLNTIHIHEAGSCSEIRTAIQCLKASGVKVAAVLDGDQHPKPAENIFTLPGTNPPEKELFMLDGVKNHLQTNYALKWDDFVASENLTSVNHHEWLNRLAKRISADKHSLTWELSRIAAGLLPNTELVNQLKESVN